VSWFTAWKNCKTQINKQQSIVLNNRRPSATTVFAPHQFCLPALRLQNCPQPPFPVHWTNCFKTDLTVSWRDYELRRRLGCNALYVVETSATFIASRPNRNGGFTNNGIPPTYRGQNDEDGYPYLIHHRTNIKLRSPNLCHHAPSVVNHTVYEYTRLIPRPWKDVE
jgi:hypothetical protein